MDIVSRRKFLKLVAGSAAGMALSPRLALAQSLGAGTGKNFIVVNLHGGVDGLSMCSYYRGPVADYVRNQARRTLAVNPSTVIPIVSQTGETNAIGLHPSLSALVAAAGPNIKIIQKYGIIDDPGRSHDTCQILVSLGQNRLSGGDQQGVVARLMDQQNWESFQYWAIGSPLLVDINTRNNAPIVLSELSSFNYAQAGWEEDRDIDLAAETQKLLLEVQVPRNQAAERYKNSQLIMHNVVSVVRSDISVQSVGQNSAGNYSEGGVGPSFKDAAKVLKAKANSANFGQRNKNTILYLTQDGYDTHSNQLSEDGLPNLLTNLGNNLAVLIQDLKRFGMWQNTVILLFSEFGRTVFQNGTEGEGSVGTDHGWGNNTIVIGGGVRAGVLGEVPSLGELQDGDINALVPTVDFRRIWGDVLTWLDVNPGLILNESGFSYSPLGIFS